MVDPAIPLVIALSLAVLWLVAAPQKLLSFEIFSTVWPTIGWFLNGRQPPAQAP